MEARVFVYACRSRGTRVRAAKGKRKSRRKWRWKFGRRCGNTTDHGVDCVRPRWLLFAWQFPHTGWCSSFTHTTQSTDYSSYWCTLAGPGMQHTLAGDYWTQTHRQTGLALASSYILSAIFYPRSNDISIFQ